MNFGHFWVFWRFFFGYTGIPLPPPPPPADPRTMARAKSSYTTGVSLLSVSRMRFIFRIYISLGANFKKRMKLPLLPVL